MKWLFLIPFLHAGSFVDSLNLKHKLVKKEVQTLNGREISWSFSDAKTPHLIQSFNKAGQLLSEKNDRDGNKIFEETLSVDLANNTSVQSFDIDQDGRFETVKKISHTKKYLVITTLIYNVRKNSYEIKSEVKVPRSEALANSELCNSDPNQNPIFDSVEAFKPLLQNLLVTGVKDDFTLTTFGPRIHESCLKKYGKDYPALVQKSLREGISCLSKVDGPGSRENLTKMASLLENKENPLTIYCGDHPYQTEDSWTENVIAQATTSGDPGFPSISFNPGRPNNAAEVQNTLLHEFLHNCGHVHGPDEIEYMYACPKCCEQKPMDEKTGECLICAGDFKSTATLEYQMALTSVSYSEIAPDLSQRLISGKFEKQKEAPLVFLRSIQFNDTHADLYAQLYAYYQQKGLIASDNTYLYPPKNPASSVSARVKALADAFIDGNNGNLPLAITDLSKTADSVAKMPADSPLRTYYASLIEQSWSEQYNLKKLDPNNQKLKNFEQTLWNLHTKFTPPK